MKKRIRLFLVTAICIFTFVCLLLYRINEYKSMGKLSDNYNASEYIKCANLYIKLKNYKIDKNDSDVIKGNCNKLIELYNKGKSAYDETLNFFNTVERIDKLENIGASSKKEIEELKMSKDAFIAGTESMERKDYKKAINQFSVVIKEDEINYARAQELKEEAVKYAEDLIKYEIKDCKIKYSESDLKSIYKDQIQVKIKNNFNKSIKSFDICFIAYDKNNTPIVIPAESNYNKNYFIICTGQNVNIRPDSLWGDERIGWNVDDSGNISYVTGEIKKIEFEDGEEWDNPLYDMWLEKSLEKIW